MSAVPSAVRLPRSAGGRRALLTLLVLGGLLALAFLFGGSAQAASGPALPDGAATAGLVKSGKAADAPAGSSAEGPVTGRLDPESSFEEEFDESRRESRTAAHEAAGKVTEPVTESADKATRPVGETVSGVTGAVDLDEVTDRVALDGKPADQSGSGEAEPVGDSGDSKSDAGQEDSSRTAAHSADESAQHSTPLSAPVLPDGVPASHVSSDDGTDQGSGRGGSGQGTPLQDAPCVPASSSAQSAGDGKSGPRGGADQLAAYVSDMERFCLLRPGAVSAADGTPTRDRSAEILEFPG